MSAKWATTQVIEAAQASTRMSGASSAMQSVNHIAHLSGALVGACLVWLLSRVPSEPSDREVTKLSDKTDRKTYGDQPDGQDVLVRDKKSTSVTLNLRKHKMNKPSNVVKTIIPKSTDSTSFYSSGLFDEAQVILLRMWNLKLEVLFSFGPFLIVFLAFVVFVFWNGSIVLGAKEAHTASLHFAMYFALVSALAMAPFYFSYSQFSMLCKSLSKNGTLSLVQVVTVSIAEFLSVHYCRWGQVFILDALSKYKAANAREAENIVERSHHLCRTTIVV